MIDPPGIKKKIFLIVSSLVIITEFLLSTFGPMATLARTTVILAPVYCSKNIDKIFIEQLSDVIESNFVKTGTFTIVKQSRWEDYYYINPEKKKEFQHYSDYLKIAKDNGIEKLIVASLYNSSTNGYSLNITLKDVNSDINMKRSSYRLSNIEELENSGEMINDFSINGTRFSIFDIFFIILLMLQSFIVYLAVFNKKPILLIEITITITIALFLFAFFYAKNANMDYFQKFVATKGQVTIAQDTFTEQLDTFARFSPIFLINIFLYLYIKVKEIRKNGINNPFNSLALPFAILSAILYSLSFPNQLIFRGSPILAYISLVPLFLILINTGYLKGVFYGSIFGILQGIIINFWQGTYSYIGLQLVSIGLLIEFILFMLLLNYVIKISGRWKLLIVPITWTVFEYFRSIGYIGYPWGLIGTSQFSFTPFIQLASITGIWGISLLLLYSNSAIAWIVQLIFKNRQLKIGRKQLVFPLSILLLCTINILGGFISIHIIDKNINKAEEFKNIVVVQQNRDPRKHSYQQSLDFAMELTDLAIEELGYTPDLVVWPEGAFKPDIRWYLAENRTKSQNKDLADQLIDFVISKNIFLVTGTQDHIFLGEERRNLNSSALINPDGTINVIYHKIKLVPFTEHFPYKRQLPWMWEFLQKFDTSNWLAGTERKIMNIEGLKVFTPICFEDVFPDHIRRFVLDGGDLIANISNDYWSLSPIEGLQHGIIGLFRSVENRRPMVRATCSGYTVAVDSAGRITDEVSGFFEKGYIIAQIPEMDYPLSVYTRFGDWLPMFLLVLLGIFIIYRIIIYYLLDVFKLLANSNSNSDYSVSRNIPKHALGMKALNPMRLCRFLSGHRSP